MWTRERVSRRVDVAPGSVTNARHNGSTDTSSDAAASLSPAPPFPPDFEAVILPVWPARCCPEAMCHGTGRGTPPARRPARMNESLPRCPLKARCTVSDAAAMVARARTTSRYTSDRRCPDFRSSGVKSSGGSIACARSCARSYMALRRWSWTASACRAVERSAFRASAFFVARTRSSMTRVFWEVWCSMMRLSVSIVSSFASIAVSHPADCWRRAALRRRRRATFFSFTKGESSSPSRDPPGSSFVSRNNAWRARSSSMRASFCLSVVFEYSRVLRR
mmetsp:Transcript_68972/g.165099  ORF Transcript_68972/g.165099 Transcript_68972/m.165099 type:complete len:278 (+) Transcript_68972:522-1355(+)